MNKIDVKIVLGEGAQVPKKGTNGSAAYDIVCPKDTFLKPGRGKIDTNIKMDIPYGVGGFILSRSGFDLKGFEAVDVYGNKVRIDCDGKRGLIDSDYRGVVGFIINNHDNIEGRLVRKGERIAQIVFMPVYDVNFIVTDSLENTERDGGYGSTGTGV